MSQGARAKLTFREYLNFPDDGRRHEIVDGEHHVKLAPETYHQTISKRLLVQLYEQIELAGFGEVFQAPTDVKLSEISIVQPDLVVVLKPKQAIITLLLIDGVPDLVIEILSKSTRTLDLGAKLELYRRARVPEYWIVDPDDHLVVQHLLQQDGGYRPATQDQTIQFHGLAGVSIDLSRVWDG